MGRARVWTMRDGGKIKIKDMEDSHILNTIKMLLRIAGKYQSDNLAYFPCLQGEMAQEHAEREWEYLNESTPSVLAQELFGDRWEGLIYEAKKRGLKWDA